MALKIARKQLHILFTSVGRRVELIQAFNNAAEDMNVDLTIYGVDITNTAPALFFCDEWRKVCRISDPNYISQLVSICENDAIDLLIPTIDTDLQMLSQEQEKFEAVGTKVLISAPDKIKVCRDKRLTADFFRSCGLKAPITTDDIDKCNFGFPCFIKPKDGSSSIDAFKVNNYTDLVTYANKLKEYIIQPFIDGTEYTIDIFCDFKGDPVYITPRERVAVSGGEVIKAMVFQDEQMIAEAKLLISAFKPYGQITVQLIRQNNTGDDYFIEINPRFGGGAPLSMKAGADSAKAAVQLLLGEKLEYQQGAAKDGVIYSRFHESVCINEVENKPLEIENILDFEKACLKMSAVIFDLDDTLYSEKDYVRSGFNAVAAVILQVDGAASKLWKAFEAGKSAIDEVLTTEGIYTEALKTKCLSAYRVHKPEISLYHGVEDMLMRLRDSGVKLGIITDGRPEGQKAKLEALKLNKIFDEIIITDELAGHGDVEKFRKPNKIAFQLMKARLGISYKDMVYIGDNIRKDFKAPLKLGMNAVWFRNKDGLYND